MKKFEGKLEYHKWTSGSCKIHRKKADGGTVDIWAEIQKFLLSINGKSISQISHLESHTIRVRAFPITRYIHTPDQWGPLEDSRGSIKSYLHQNLSCILEAFSGRNVFIEISDGKVMTVRVDPKSVRNVPISRRHLRNRREKS